MSLTDPSIAAAPDAWARRAFAANGFGDAALPRRPPPRRSAMLMQVTPRFHRRPALREGRRGQQAHPLGHRPRRDPRPRVRLREEVPARRAVVRRPARASCPPTSAASCRRCRAARTRTSSAWSSASSAPRSSSSSRGHGSATRSRSRRSCASPTRSSSTRRLFRRLGAMMAADMPAGYRFLPDPNEVARDVLSKSTWAVLALTCHIELFMQAHYRASIDPDAVAVAAVQGRVPLPLAGGVAARDRRRARVGGTRTRR